MEAQGHVAKRGTRLEHKRLEQQWNAQQPHAQTKLKGGGNACKRTQIKLASEKLYACKQETKLASQSPFASER
jgi:hypothetical protein